MPPVAWIVRLWKDSPSTNAVFLLHAADLKHFAAEPDHQSRADVGICGVAPLRSHQRLESLALGGDAAASAVHQRDDAVDGGVIGKNSGAFDLPRDQARDGRRAIHRSQDGEIVARPDFPVRPAEPLKARPVLDRRDRLGACVLAEMIVAREVLHGAIVLMHPLARGDRTRGETDDLPKLADRRARVYGGDRHLMAFRNALASGDAARRSDAGGDLVDRDDDVVRSVEAQSAGRCHDFFYRSRMVHLRQEQSGALFRQRLQ